MCIFKSGLIKLRSSGEHRGGNYPGTLSCSQGSATHLNIDTPRLNLWVYRSSNELQWLDLKTEYQHCSTSNGRQGHMLYCPQPTNAQLQIIVSSHNNTMTQPLNIYDTVCNVPPGLCMVNQSMSHHLYTVSTQWFNDGLSLRANYDCFIEYIRQDVYKSLKRKWWNHRLGLHMTTSCAANEYNSLKTTGFTFQWYIIPWMQIVLPAIISSYYSQRRHPTIKNIPTINGRYVTLLFLLFDK